MIPQLKTLEYNVKGDVSIEGQKVASLKKSHYCLKYISNAAFSDVLPRRSLWTTSATPGRPLMLSSMWEQAGKH